MKITPLPGAGRHIANQLAKGVYLLLGIGVLFGVAVGALVMWAVFR